MVAILGVDNVRHSRELKGRLLKLSFGSAVVRPCGDVIGSQIHTENSTAAARNLSPTCARRKELATGKIATAPSPLRTSR